MAKDEKIMELVAPVHDFVLTIRRHFHQHPELGLKEFETAARIRQELDEMGIKWVEASPTGTIGIIEGNGQNPENILALRGDIDALPIQEETDVPFKSVVPNVMHACGHDSHAAMLLGAGKVLKQYEGKFPGTIWLLFQPGEETTMGAKAVIASGALNGVKSMYGQHIMTSAPSGVFATQGGEFMAGARVHEIFVQGRGGHGSDVSQTIDPVLVASQIVINLQNVITHGVKPLESATVCVGAIHSGSAANVVPDTATLLVSTRFFSKEMENRLTEKITNICQTTAEMYGATATVTVTGGISALETDVALTENLKKSLAKVVGEDHIVDAGKALGSEDFAEYCDLCPVCFAIIGCMDEAKGTNTAHHSPTFKIDEDVFDIGVAGYVQYTLDYFGTEI